MNDNFIITEIKRVIFIGKDEYSDNNLSFSGNLVYNELILHLSGKGTVNFNNTILECEKNTIRFLPKGKSDIYTVETLEKGDCIDIFFDADHEISPCAFCVNIKNNEKIVSLFKQLFSVWVAKNDGGYFECISLLYKIFSEMQKKTYIPNDWYKKIEPAIKYIRENFISENISVPLLAQKCGVSETYLKKLFVKCFSLPPSKYIIQMKINAACDLLASERFSINEIADFCGYSDVFFFSRQFKKYVGISPREFKEKYKSSK